MSSINCRTAERHPTAANRGLARRLRAIAMTALAFATAADSAAQAPPPDGYSITFPLADLPGPCAGVRFTITVADGAATVYAQPATTADGRVLTRRFRQRRPNGLHGSVGTSDCLFEIDIERTSRSR